MRSNETKRLPHRRTVNDFIHYSPSFRTSPSRSTRGGDRSFETSGVRPWPEDFPCPSKRTSENENALRMNRYKLGNLAYSTIGLIALSGIILQKGSLLVYSLVAGILLLPLVWNRVF